MLWILFPPQNSFQVRISTAVTFLKVDKSFRWASGWLVGRAVSIHTAGTQSPPERACRVEGRSRWRYGKSRGLGVDSSKPQHGYMFWASLVPINTEMVT